MRFSINCTLVLMIMGSLLTALAFGCSHGDDRSKQSCDLPDTGLPVRLSGHVFGYGRIFTENAPSDAVGSLLVRVETIGPDIGMDLAGSGTCLNGVLRAKFAGGHDRDAKVRVLGGSLVVVIDHEPMSHVFGVWEVRAQREELDDPSTGRSFHGLIEVVAESELEDRSAANDALSENQKVRYAAGELESEKNDEITGSP